MIRANYACSVAVDRDLQKIIVRATAQHTIAIYPDVGLMLNVNLTVSCNEKRVARLCGPLQAILESSVSLHCYWVSPSSNAPNGAFSGSYCLTILRSRVS